MRTALDSDKIDDHYSKICKWADHSFKDHVLVPLQDSGVVQLYLCRKPGTTDYHFNVVLSPRHIAIYGDIGDRQLIVYGSGTCEKLIGWIRGAVNSVGYMIEKMTVKEKMFFPLEARILLQEHLDGEHGEEPEEAKKFVEAVRYDWHQDYDTYEEFAMAYVDNDGDCEMLDNTVDYDAHVYWSVNCLKKFVELYDAYYHGDADESG